MSVSTVMMQLTFVIGATAGGFVLAQVGTANTYWIDVISYFVVIAALLVMVIPRIPAERRAQAGVGALVYAAVFVFVVAVTGSNLAERWLRPHFDARRFPVAAADFIAVSLHQKDSRRQKLQRLCPTPTANLNRTTRRLPPGAPRLKQRRWDWMQISLAVRFRWMWLALRCQGRPTKSQRATRTKRSHRLRYRRPHQRRS